MKPEHLVPTLETCKKLKDFPETFFVWDDNSVCFFLDRKENSVFDYPAPTVAELMDVLPEHITGVRGRYHLSVCKLDSKEGIVYDACYERDGDMITINDELLLSEQICYNPAEALALLYIELKEKGV